MTLMTSRTSCPPRYGTQRSPDRATLGPAIGLVAAKLRKPFMPWQQYVADVIGEIDPATGRLAYDEVCLTVPRQSGKSTFVEAKAAHRCSATGFYGGRQRIVYTAQTRLKAREKWEEDFLADLQASPAFRNRVEPSLANGNEHMRFPNGSRWGIEANTEKAGHGGTLDEAYIDEAFSHTDWRLEQAFGPAMITRANKLLLVISTAGWLGASPYLEAKVEAGRRMVAEGRTSGLAYFEWSAPQDAEPGDEAVWWQCMPALGHTISVEDIRREYQKAVDQGKLNEFKRAYLNQWVPKDMPDDWLVIPRAAWKALEDPESHPEPRVVLSAAFSHDQSKASVGLAGWRPDGLLHGEVADYQAGTSWVVPRLVEMNARHDPLGVVVDEGSHEAVIIKDLEAAGVPVIKIGTRGVMQAFAELIEDVLDSKRFRHRGQQDLDDALAAAMTRDIGDGGKAWGRKKSAGDISPVVSVSHAAWGLRKETTAGGGDPGAWLI